MEKRRVSFHTLGCKMNFSESSTLARIFEQGGFERAASCVDADVCVINSCSVTEHADKKCRNLIRRIHRLNPNAIIAVTGCYAQLKPHEIADIEGVDIVLGNNYKGDLYQRVLELAGKGRAKIYSCDTESLTRFFAAFSSGDRTRSFLKVQDGCDYKCAYCTIHYARGSSRNMPIADLVAEARTLAAAGTKEIVVTGINTGDFGRTTGESFVDLIRALDTVEGIERYRISSIEPNLLTDTGFPAKRRRTSCRHTRSWSASHRRSYTYSPSRSVPAPPLSTCPARCRPPSRPSAPHVSKRSANASTTTSVRGMSGHRPTFSSRVPYAEA